MSQEIYSPKSANPHIKDIEEYQKLHKESIENPKEFFQKLANENIDQSIFESNEIAELVR